MKSRIIGDRAPYTKRTFAGGRHYTYFNMGGQTYVPMPNGDDPEFSRRYAELLAEREWRIKAPTTVRALIKAYEKSKEFSRLSERSKINYLAAFRRMDAAGHILIDEFTTANCAELGLRIEKQGARTSFYRRVTILYLWAMRKHYSALTESPAFPLIPRRPRTSEWVYIIGSDANAPVIIGVAFQRRGDNWSGNGAYEYYRWYSTATAQLVPGSNIFSVDFNSLGWFDVWGQPASAHQAEFNAAKADPQAIMITFGCDPCAGRSHGVNGGAQWVHFGLLGAQ